MGLEEKLPSGILLTTVEQVAGYARKGSLWPATFGLACCAIEIHRAKADSNCPISFAFMRGPMTFMKHMFTWDRLPFTATYGCSVMATLYAVLVVGNNCCGGGSEY